MDKAKYAGGLNEFSYCASLHISHPTLDPAEITTHIGIEPVRTSRVGQARRSNPNRVHDRSNWSCRLPVNDGDEIPTFLEQIVALLSQHRAFLERVSDGGGEIECFIGIFPDRLCDQCYSHELLASIAALRINLRFDYYASECKHH